MKIEQKLMLQTSRTWRDPKYGIEVDEDYEEPTEDQIIQAAIAILEKRPNVTNFVPNSVTALRKVMNF